MADGDQIPVIKKLPESVIAKIAAGEVVQRPVNVLKELLENSLDAGSTRIVIKCEFTKDDFKKILIQDNGCGIKESDFAWACERFATSKIDSFDSLSSLSTFGFRGEALASISQVSILEIVSKRPGGDLGFRQRYQDGKPLFERPEPLAANDGTIVTVLDLFYNNVHRKKALSGHTAEFKKMVELVALYSLDNLDVSFNMTKINGRDVEIATKAGCTLRDRITNVISAKTAANLIDFHCLDEKLKYSATGVIGDLTSSLPNYRFVFFLNRRLVHISSLHKSLEVFYKDKLAKGSCPFVYLSITIEPSFVDANVHPSKNEVRLINEREVVAQITEQVEKLLENQKDREISLNSPLQKTVSVTFIDNPDANSTPKTNLVQTNLDKSFGFRSASEVFASPSNRPEQKVRHDIASQRIDEMFHRQKTNTHNDSTYKNNAPRHKGSSSSSGNEEFFVRDGVRIANLESVRTLRRRILDAKDVDLNTMLVNSSYVGSYHVKKPTLFIQYDVNLVQIDLKELSKDLFYQIFLYNFGNLHQFKFDKPVPIRNFAQAHMARLNLGHLHTSKVECMMTKVLSMSAMMDDYFSLGITSSGQLTAIPELLEGYIPSWQGLPEFCYDLLFNVDWTDEIVCFDTFARALGKLYLATEESCQFAPVYEEEESEQEIQFDSSEGCDEVLQLSSQESNAGGQEEPQVEVLPPLDDATSRTGVIASVIYPALKSKFMPTQLSAKCFALRTTVPQLYKVFHRC